MNAPASNRWEDFTWPIWVPGHERDLIEDFWSPANGRGPREWLESARINRCPETGTVGRWWLIFSSRRTVLCGRYLHRWNNIGVVVMEDGRVEVAGDPVTEGSLAVRRRALEAKRAEFERDIRELEAAEAQVLGDTTKEGIPS